MLHSTYVGSDRQALNIRIQISNWLCEIQVCTPYTVERNMSWGAL